jgi:hypothetical protein
MSRTTRDLYNDFAPLDEILIAAAGEIRGAPGALLSVARR